MKRRSKAGKVLVFTQTKILWKVSRKLSLEQVDFKDYTADSGVILGSLDDGRKKWQRRVAGFLWKKMFGPPVTRSFSGKYVCECWEKQWQSSGKICRFSLWRFSRCETIFICCPENDAIMNSTFITMNLLLRLTCSSTSLKSNISFGCYIMN